MEVWNQTVVWGTTASKRYKHVPETNQTGVVQDHRWWRCKSTFPCSDFTTLNFSTYNFISFWKLHFHTLLEKIPHSKVVNIHAFFRLNRKNFIAPNVVNDDEFFSYYYVLLWLLESSEFNTSINFEIISLQIFEHEKGIIFLICSNYTSSNFMYVLKQMFIVAGCCVEMRHLTISYGFFLYSSLHLLNFIGFGTLTINISTVQVGIVLVV